jgi:hypothetical protein
VAEHLLLPQSELALFLLPDHVPAIRDSNGDRFPATFSNHIDANRLARRDRGDPLGQLVPAENRRSIESHKTVASPEAREIGGLGRTLAIATCPPHIVQAGSPHATLRLSHCRRRTAYHEQV